MEPFHKVILGIPADEIMAIGRVLERKLDQALAGYGLTMSGFMVLKAIGLHRDGTTQAALLEFLSITQPSLACQIARLTKARWVHSRRRTGRNEDSRQKALTLTPEGSALLVAAEGTVAETAHFSFSHFEKAESHRLAQYLRRLRVNVLAEDDSRRRLVRVGEAGPEFESAEPLVSADGCVQTELF